jgi:hypothetical protein
MFGFFLSDTGCFNPFAPRLTNSLQSTNFIVTQQQSPDELLHNFKMAYTFRDSLLYSDLLDSAFLFIYFDPAVGTSGRFVSWGKEEDLLTTGRLFRHFQVVDLVWNAVIYESMDGMIGEMSKGFNLTLIGEDSDFKLSGRAVFTFRKCSDEKWRITRWKDESDI